MSTHSKHSRLKVLLTVTDGYDNTDNAPLSFEEAISKLGRSKILSLTCGIGSVEVDHWGLQNVARAVGGCHIVIRHSSGIAQALADLTTLVHTRALAITSVCRAKGRLQAEQVGLVSQNRNRFPIDVMILIDRSWSMLGMRQYQGVKDEWSGDRQKLAKTKGATAALVRSLNPKCDRVSVAAFCGQYRLLQRLTSDFRSCMRAIEGIDGGYGTALYRAMSRAIDDLMV